MKLRTNNPNVCVGSIFDLSLGSSAGGGGRGNPQWVVGDSFLVGYRPGRFGASL